MVGEDGFEPSKRNAADLQSVKKRLFAIAFRIPDINLTQGQKILLYSCLLFAHVFGHAVVEFSKGFAFLVGSQFGVNALRYLDSGMTKDALRRINIHVQFKHQRGCSVPEIVGTDRRFPIFANQTGCGTVSVPHPLVTSQRHRTAAFTTPITCQSRKNIVGCGRPLSVRQVRVQDINDGNDPVTRFCFWGLDRRLCAHGVVQRFRDADLIVLQIHIIPRQSQSLGLSQAGAEQEEGEQTEGGVDVGTDGLDLLISRGDPLSALQALREFDGGDRIVLGVIVGDGVIEDHSVQRSDGVDHCGTVALCLGCSQMIDDFEGGHLGNGLATMLGQDVLVMRRVVDPSSGRDLLPVLPLPVFGDLPEGRLLRLWVLELLELLKQLLRVTVIRIVAAGVVRVTALITAVFAQCEHICVFYFLCHLTFLSGCVTLKGQTTPLVRLGWFCLHIPCPELGAPAGSRSGVGAPGRFLLVS